jgi:hypothetical protein
MHFGVAEKILMLNNNFLRTTRLTKSSLPFVYKELLDPLLKILVSLPLFFHSLLPAIDIASCFTETQ